MTYLIGQIALCLLLASLLGLVIGWLLSTFLGQAGRQGLVADRDAARAELHRFRADLTSANARVKAAEDGQTSAEASKQTAEAALAALKSEHAADREALLLAHNQRDVLAQQLVESDDALKACRARRDVLTAELAKPNESDSPNEDEGTKLKKLRKDLAQAKATIAGLKAEAPSNLLEAPPSEPDDLKRIKGIGPVFEGLLNSLGVYHFHQIAAFSETDVSWVASRIDTFPDRIGRDDWIGQAKELK